MKHYTLEEWVEFIHTVAPASTTVAMREHLDHCPHCLHALEWWRGVSDGASKERDPAPGAKPDNAHEGGQRAAVGGARTVNAVAELVLDTVRQPPPADLRSSPMLDAAQHRQLAYRVGEYVIDMLVDFQPETEDWLLTGQILHTDRRHADVSAIPVVLEGRGKSSATTTNRLGEFQFKLASASPAQISFLFRTAGKVVIPLDSVLKPPKSTTQAGSAPRVAKQAG